MRAQDLSRSVGSGRAASDGLRLELSPLESYAIGLVNEEAGEIVQEVGKTLRFGLDTCSPPDGRYAGTTPRERMTNEAGDMLAALWFICECSVLDWNEIEARADRKIVLHRDPDFRRLAWQPAPASPTPNQQTDNQGSGGRDE